jgi:hypothetical protein
MKILAFLLALGAGSLAAQSASQEFKPELEPLAYFRGAWSCEGHFFQGNRSIAADMTYTSELGGTWLMHRHDDRPPNQFHALELWGYDKTAKHFVSFLHDSLGGVRLFTSPGWETDRLLWTGNALAPNSKIVEHFIFERKSESRFVMSYEWKNGDAAWTPVDTVTCTRKPAG